METRRTVTLVPWRGGEPRREWLWDMTKPSLLSLGYPLYTGDSEGEWARAAAMNNAAKAAGDWEIALLGDADTIPDPDSISRAVAWVASTKGAARPHMERWMLTEEGTMILVRRGAGALEYPKHYDKQFQGGGLLVVHRECWDAVGGFDEKFVGWGHEDSAFNLRALRRSRWDRLPGEAWHLWHPRGQRAKAYSVELYHRLLRGYASDMDEWSRDKGLKGPVKEIF